MYKRQVQTQFGNWPVSVIKNTEDSQITGNIDLFIRPFSMHLEQSDQESSSLILIDVRHTGQAEIVTIETASGNMLKLYVDNQKEWKVGQTVSLHPQMESLFAFPA